MSSRMPSSMPSCVSSCMPPSMPWLLSSLMPSRTRSTTAILIGTTKYKSPVTDTTTGNITELEKHILELMDISIVTINYPNTNNKRRTLNVPWMNTPTNNSSRNYSPRGAIPRSNN
ncbi:hypothetical protein Glove_122g31 [Diversispora epigaea]|uniref:Uncharacterized protein n=1 Tax=Diversispora epigaea TaxID=1348612 RepID=A0A397J7U7_9GLOM|nr:hypothetical protein Glove_122g31 [Diversispora epigaea]